MRAELSCTCRYMHTPDNQFQHHCSLCLFKTLAVSGLFVELLGSCTSIWQLPIEHYHRNTPTGLVHVFLTLPSAPSSHSHPLCIRVSLAMTPPKTKTNVVTFFLRRITIANLTELCCTEAKAAPREDGLQALSRSPQGQGTFFLSTS
jgi:hypothetical protein